MAPRLRNYIYHNEAPAGTACLAKLILIPVVYDIVLVVNEHDLPEVIRDQQPGNFPRFRPCWSPRDHTFTWQPLNRLFALDPSQRVLFCDAQAQKDFIDQYRAEIMQDAKIYIERSVTDSIRRKPSSGLIDPRPARRLRNQPFERFDVTDNTFFLNDDEDSGNSDFTSNLHRRRGVNSPRDALLQQPSLIDHFSRRSSQAQPMATESDFVTIDHATTRPYTSNITHSTTTTPINLASPDPAPELCSPLPSLIIKSESEPVPAHLLNVPSSKKVKIYIGPSTYHFTVLREDLEHSPVLKSWIIEAEKGSFIMRPELLDIRRSDFQTIVQYLHSQEYAPLLMEDPGNPTGPKVWDKMDAGDYPDQLVRAGRYYVMAQRFQVKGMPEKIYDKITSVDASKFNMKSLVNLATTLFEDGRDLSHLQTDVTTNDGANPIISNDDLEEWVISKIAMSFKQIMLIEQTLFWKMESKTRTRQLMARILNAASEIYRAAGRLNEEVIHLE